MLTTKKVREILMQPWWTLVKNEVARAIAVRIKAKDPDLRPHGTILGQMFIDVLNVHSDCRAYFHYLTTRKWSEILTDAAEDLSDQMLEVLRHEQAEQWFTEFQKFLITAW